MFLRLDDQYLTQLCGQFWVVSIADERKIRAGTCDATYTLCSDPIPRAGGVATAIICFQATK